ncbi:unnamed protein product, partial [Effrenium voratum]
MVTDRILAESRCLVMCAGGMITSSLSHPMDTLKCRWQVAGKPWQGQHLTDFARALLREEGISAGLWRPGFLANVMSMAWCVGMRNGLYPTFRDGIGKLYTIAGGEPGKAGPSSMFCAGLLSGCSGYLVASPLLQVKTQMQAEAGKLGLDGLYASGLHVGLAPTYSSTWQALASHSCGSLGGSLRSLWRGAGVIVARGAALSASQLMAYDQSKTVLKERKEKGIATAMQQNGLPHAMEKSSDAQNAQEPPLSEEVGGQRSLRACPQRIVRNGETVEVWPEHWGMTMQQIRELMDDCKEDADWHQDNSVRDMVKKHILPRTAGDGVGYALKINHAMPLEVEVLVSHSWNENAEEFVETLERTVYPNEVLFVCAFAIYQNEDEAGPSVMQQIGCSMKNSPFERVLRHIQDRGLEAGTWWWPRRFFHILPGLCLLMALEIFMISQLLCGGVPGMDCLFKLEHAQGQRCGGWRSAGHGTCLATHWVRKDMDPMCKPAFSAVWGFALVGFGISLWLHCVKHRVYYGRMVAVPNYQDNLYQRLWCVYEIFMASQLKVYVSLAHTLAPAGKCTARTARCSDAADEARIRREIEAFGARCVHKRSSSVTNNMVRDIFAAEGGEHPRALAAEVGYRRVDAAIRWTTSRAQREWLWVMVRITLLGTALQGSVTILSYSMGLLRTYFALGYALAFLVYMVLMWSILRRTGCLQRKHLLVLGLLPFCLGVICVCLA